MILKYKKNSVPLANTLGLLLLGTSTLAIASSAYANETEALQEGRYIGQVHELMTNAGSRYCIAHEVDITIQKNEDSSYFIRWLEEGRMKGDWTFCERLLDMTLRPTEGRENEWNVRFNWQHHFYAGKAVLKDGTLHITARYDNTSLDRFEARWHFSEDKDVLQYTREFDSFGSFPRRASGNLLRLN